MIILSGFIGALIGALSTFWFNMWKFYRDERTARCDELCKALQETGLLASQYWSKKFDAVDSQAIEECRLLASQTLLEGMYEDFKEYHLPKRTAPLDERMSEFMDAVTGGEFSVDAREKDVDRMGRAPRMASLIIIDIRRANRESIPLHDFLKQLRANRRMELDMPAGWNTGA